ncbi:tyrosine-protein kinase transforming protein Fes [Capsaspora owczarzaki ATCC 30864]|uniref:tyrosine-protein kinase transforming protein Fes n=1 Tax=Capsaspora owczarzaki (strain ATCC 30864) TaxID=595528 RepID=UPI00035210FF|nr:tyrosine-protein kinase transforming protein Fes [Capsaspora owczarzaki ATCC 30864]|eukprot:XP_004340662.2 tyrosine-protein kinase transforming protein Fes [Capsaspora owczarzaki ATCC 30864]
MSPTGVALGLLLLLPLLLFGVMHDVHLAHAANACDPGVCSCYGTTVDCGAKSLTAFPSGIPVNATQLLLGSNLIPNISSTAFAGLTALTTIYLNDNQLTSIPASAFSDLSALMLLDLRGNILSSIAADAFTGLIALNSLNLYDNQITSIPADTFTGLTSLKQLYISSNQITDIAATVFTSLSALSVLYLHSNKITSIPANAFTGLTLLAQLYLQINQITSIAANTFAGLLALTRLALNDNPVTTLPPGLFKGLKNSLALSYSNPYLSPNNFTFGGNSVAPPSTYGIATNPYKCDTACATCYASGNGSCCAMNCLACDSSDPCTQCYEGYGLIDGSCVSLASIASASLASAASTASASVASVASTASASAASVASSIAQHGGGGSQDSSSSSAAVIAAVVACVVVVAIIAAVFIVMRRRRSQRRSGTRPKDSTGPIHQEAIEMTISPLIHSPRAQKEEDIEAYAVVGQKQPEPLYQAISTSSKEVVYDYASAYVAGSNSRRIREGLTIVKHLASGNFGDVALGQLSFSVLPPRAQNLLGPAASETVQVAVKSLKSDADEKSRKDFESEAKLMAPFVHTNVVRLLAALVESEPHLVLLEFVQYGDLRTMLQKSKLRSLWWTQNEQIHAIRQIALGMEYLGTLHFVHRDLAARNCLVGQGMVVKIADFGLSRELASENDYYRMQTRGKLPVKWMAPETMTFRKFSTMSDVWAFGVTAWECSSHGAKPYGEMDGRDTLARVEAGGRLAIPEHCSPELYSLMLTCWDMPPEKRPTFAQLVQSLTALQDGTTIREIGAML